MIEYVCILIIAEIRPICMITKRMVGQPWFAQLNKFIIQFTCILANNMRLNIYPNFMLHFFIEFVPTEKKNVLLLIPWGSGSVINASYFIKRSEKNIYL